MSGQFEGCTIVGVAMAAGFDTPPTVGMEILVVAAPLFKYFFLTLKTLLSAVAISQTSEFRIKIKAGVIRVKVTLYLLVNVKMGNKQGSLANHLETASKTGALAFPGKVRIGNASVKIPTHYLKKNVYRN